MLSFIRQEKGISALATASFCVVLFKVFTDGVPELFPHAGALVEVLYNLALSTVAAVIFYIFQVYLTAARVRKIAIKEMTALLSKIVDYLQNILVSTLEPAKLNTTSFSSLDDFLSDSTAKEISTHFNLEALAYPISPLSPWKKRLEVLGDEVHQEAITIASIYANHLTEAQLRFLYELRCDAGITFMRTFRNPEFIELLRSNEGKALIPQGVFEGLFQKILASRNVGIEVRFSDSFLQSQKLLVGKARV